MPAVKLDLISRRYARSFSFSFLSSRSLTAVRGYRLYDISRDRSGRLSLFAPPRRRLNFALTLSIEACRRTDSARYYFARFFNLRRLPAAYLIPARARARIFVFKIFSPRPSENSTRRIQPLFTLYLRSGLSAYGPFAPKVHPVKRRPCLGRSDN